MKRVLLAAAAGLLSTNAASAATIIQTGSFSTTGAGSLTDMVNAFNPAQGTLVSVDLFVHTTATAAGRVTNNSNTAGTFTVTVPQNSTYIVYSFGALSLTVPLDTSSSLRIGPKGRPNNFANYSLTSDVFDDTTWTSGLSPFIGTVPIPLNYITTYNVLLTGPAGGVLSNQTYINAGEFTLNYNYVSVPEPASWALMLVGFGMIGFTVRYRMRNAARVTYA